MAETSVGKIIEAAQSVAPKAQFKEPWEARAFAITVALWQSGRFRWDEFQRRLIAEVDAAGASGNSDASGANYYEHWLRALLAMLSDSGIADAAVLEAQIRNLPPLPLPHTRAS